MVILKPASIFVNRGGEKSVICTKIKCWFCEFRRTYKLCSTMVLTFIEKRTIIYLIK